MDVPPPPHISANFVYEVPFLSLHSALFARDFAPRSMCSLLLNASLLLNTFECFLSLILNYLIHCASGCYTIFHNEIANMLRSSIQ